MKNFRLLAGLLAVSLLPPLALAQDGGEITSLLAKARRGNGIAQYNLGLAYAEGHSVAVDPVEAYVWLSLARENGARGRALDTLAGSFDKTTLETAQRRLAERKTELGVRAVQPVPAVPPPVAPVSAKTRSAGHHGCRRNASRSRPRTEKPRTPGRARRIPQVRPPGRGHAQQGDR
ncbi:MAG: hypothetical protein WDM96_11605 [Lacunisphaera sp.]